MVYYCYLFFALVDLYENPSSVVIAKWPTFHSLAVVMFALSCASKTRSHSRRPVHWSTLLRPSSSNIISIYENIIYTCDDGPIILPNEHSRER